MPEALWTAEEIAAATGGQVAGDFAANGVSIDSRTVEPGDLFVALAGVRDGHEFVAQTAAKGAAGALVSQAVETPAVVVADTFAALEALGVAARERAPQARRGAVTGSVGKTSVTRAVEAGLRRAGKAHASVKSYNNHIGVPLTLARMPRDTERAVFEVGMNHADEITPLSKFIRPHAVAITTVGPVHLENFADGEIGVARAKAEIFDGLEPGGVAVLNADNQWFDLLKAEAETAGAVVRSFGRDGTSARLVDFVVEGAGATVVAELDGQAASFPIRQTGVHWGPNSLCVLLMLEALGVDRATALAALADFAPIEGRGAEQEIAIDGGAFTLVDESYNANPVSMQAALATLGARKVAGRRIVALTDMLELGPDSPRFHAELADAIEKAGIDLVFCAGPLMMSLWNALPQERRGGYADAAPALAQQIVAAMQPGDVVMVKGSNGSRAGAVAAALSALGRREQV
ncbi:UDP-N-acetylmuramoylalanyl-D-glutamyl-2, 6-diaminopimelate--D-alanyl-D-alanine ligase [Caulobacter flavus]|uniref:UDP-N-acetylmuramoyl-tripeptide--D-alanyl-D-alanine ligase n=1 Tax=Caulobacter flavus TaxID=1679497 RepID=A0A2N5CWI5_9CAUL|nr:UDP-N-acetylmuramoyl-tripeptide--D-alanyl-D-alanine ligase [Caulobacter flavus]AYV44832.1 UDP-N-acetylmuramoylalanyl-D-glutamyl-2, 6-diaminopimelate--D-alanyl-D-alanine ligase [Caulobacter flavus]PLR18164.1 UDP-N-acetylmuramoylalanyl-D-glutamyl-2, 6-diaminopimelate--D-alanyl-D-alanine ligase [Caulobacter flavus]